MSGWIKGSQGDLNIRVIKTHISAKIYKYTCQITTLLNQIAKVLVLSRSFCSAYLKKKHIMDFDTVLKTQLKFCQVRKLNSQYWCYQAWPYPPPKLQNTAQKSTNQSGLGELLLSVAIFLPSFLLVQLFNVSGHVAPPSKTMQLLQTFTGITKEKNWLHSNKMVCQAGNKYSAFLLGMYYFISLQWNVLPASTQRSSNSRVIVHLPVIHVH